MEQQVIKIFEAHCRRYGARRIAKTLQCAGEKVSRYKAARILNKFGVKAIQPRSFVPKTTDSRHAYKISPLLLLDKPKPGKPNEVWVGVLLTSRCRAANGVIWPYGWICFPGKLLAGTLMITCRRH